MTSMKKMNSIFLSTNQLLTISISLNDMFDINNFYMYTDLADKISNYLRTRTHIQSYTLRNGDIFKIKKITLDDTPRNVSFIFDHSEIHLFMTCVSDIEIKVKIINYLLTVGYKPENN
jgi:hypothetical protein